MTVAVEPRWRDDPGFLRDLRLLTAIGLALLAVLAGVTWRAAEWWGHRNDISVTFHPEVPTDHPFRPYGGGRTYSPGREAFAVRSQARLIVVDVESQEVVARLRHTGQVAFASDDLLVAFGTGLAVVDLSAETVVHVDADGHETAGLSPIRRTDDGRIEACTLVPIPGTENDSAGPLTRCGPERYLIDPEAAELTVR